MDALSVNSQGPAALSVLSALRPALPLAVSPTQADAVGGLAFQSVAQGLFRGSLQTAVTNPQAEVPAGLSQLLIGTGTSLAATLASATTPAPLTPAGSQAVTGVNASTAPTSSLTPTLPTPATPAQEPFAGSATTDFALQTALRFGAGVGTLAPATAPVPSLDAGLVRDAAAVPRQDGLQAREGGAGATAYRQAQTGPQALRAYAEPGLQASPSGPGQVNLLA